LSDAVGRKFVIMLADAMFTFGALIMGLSPTINCLIFGRLVVGFGIGIASMVVPIYLAELSPKQIRGQLVALNIFLVTGA